VPAEGFEPPTYGLQNRCTTTVLSRHFNDLHAFTLSSVSAGVSSVAYFATPALTARILPRHPATATHSH
jgi:hypothetical protein